MTRNNGTNARIENTMAANTNAMVRPVRKKSKHWCFTINNPTQEDSDQLDRLAEEEKITYMVVGREVGEEGTPHMQGYLVMKGRKMMTAMKKLLPRAHLEIKSKNSTYEEAIIYCKKDGKFITYGTPPVDQKKKLKRRWEDAFTAAVEGRIIDIPPDMRIRHYHAFKRIKQDYPQKLDHLIAPCGQWIWGPTGLGKSLSVWTQYPDLYPKPKNKWWDGYQMEKTVMIDDVLKTDASWIAPLLMRWADCYRFVAEHKGTSYQIRPKRIIVTSNFSIDDVFEDQPLATVDALKRRYKELYFTKAFSIIKPQI